MVGFNAKSYVIFYIPIVGDILGKKGALCKISVFLFYFLNSEPLHFVKCSHFITGILNIDYI